MNKEEIISKFGEEHYQNILKHNRENYNKRKEVWKETRTNYYNSHKDYFDNHNVSYYNSKEGRARNLLHSYQQNDIKYNRGECTLTYDWIVENIFSSSCTYCGETDYLKLGCDRIDNSKPHTPENVVCSCKKCNLKRKNKDFTTFLQDSKQK